MPFRKQHFDLLEKWGGQRYDRTNQEHTQVSQQLSDVIQVMKEWGDAVLRNAFQDGHLGQIPSHFVAPSRRDSKFREYVWIKLYPFQDAPTKLCYGLHFHHDKVMVNLDIIRSEATKDDLSRFNELKKSHELQGHLSSEEVLNLPSFDHLIEWSVTKIKNFNLSYHDAAIKLGLLTNSEDDITCVQESIEINSQNLPSDMNIILYGPPGTGKTYRLCESYFPVFTDRIVKSKDQYAEELAGSLTWWKAVAIALYDLGEPASVKSIFSHPIVSAKARGAANKTPENSIWAALQRHAKEDCPTVNYSQRKPPLVFWKDENSKWSLDMEMVDQEFPDLKETSEMLKSYKPVDSELHRYRFVTFHQSYCYEDFIEGLKPILSEESDSIDGNDIAYTVKPGVFKLLAKQALENRHAKYALFIDEINRGNIANIFGELITLIENDKRLSESENIESAVWKVDHLPYSREPFAVPSNLYIIGTMNTADRSVEALDTALRRRFSFIPVYPNPSLLRDRQPEGFEVNLEKLLTSINERLEVLLDKDHTIGHSFFWNIIDSSNHLEELRRTFANKVIPQLHEFFFSNPSQIGMVLGPSFVRRKPNLSSALIRGEDWFTDEVEQKDVFEIVPENEWTLETFKSIYG